MADDSHHNRQETDAQLLHHDRDRLWAILSCLCVVVILCIGVGSISASASVPVSDSPENAQIQQQASSNTLTIRSTGNERVTYSIAVSGTIQGGPGVDTKNAKRPDSVSRSTAVGSVAEGGIDNFTFSGRITQLSLFGEAAIVTVNGKQVNPAVYQRTTSVQTATATPTPTPTATPIPTPTMTPVPTTIPTGTAIPTVRMTTSVRFRPTMTATPVSTPTAASTATPPIPPVTSTSSTQGTAVSKPSPASPSAPSPQGSGGGGPGILDWIGSNLFLFGGLVLLGILIVAVLIERMRRKPRF